MKNVFGVFLLQISPLFHAYVYLEAFPKVRKGVKWIANNMLNHKGFIIYSKYKKGFLDERLTFYKIRNSYTICNKLKAIALFLIKIHLT